MIRHLDDTAQVDGYTAQGATVIKAKARVTGPGTLQAGDRTITAGHIIIATGSEAAFPNLEGAEHITTWTNRETFTTTTLPERAVVIGGSAVGNRNCDVPGPFWCQRNPRAPCRGPDGT